MSVDEAASLLRSTPNVIRRMCRKGELQALKVGREWRISEAQIRKMAAAIA